MQAVSPYLNGISRKSMITEEEGYPFETYEILKEQEYEAGKWRYTLPELANEASVFGRGFEQHLNARSFTVINTQQGRVVPNSSARKFISRMKGEIGPAEWLFTQHLDPEFSSGHEELPMGSPTMTVLEALEQLGLEPDTLCERIRAGQIEAYWFNGRWWIPEFVDGNQRKVSLNAPCFVADQRLHRYFAYHKGVKFLNCVKYSAKRLSKQFSKLKADEFFFDRKTRLQKNALFTEVFQQGSWNNVRFTEI